MARHRRAGSVKEPGVRPFVLDDAIGASAPGTARAEDTAAAAEPSTRRLDERVSRWLEERRRFERRHLPEEKPDASSHLEATPNP
jgi:hypothetical protein